MLAPLVQADPELELAVVIGSPEFKCGADLTVGVAGLDKEAELDDFAVQARPLNRGRSDMVWFRMSKSNTTGLRAEMRYKIASCGYATLFVYSYADKQPTSRTEDGSPQTGSSPVNKLDQTGTR